MTNHKRRQRGRRGRAREEREEEGARGLVVVMEGVRELGQ
jgi:hypothetical protein